jgi:membrane-bound lytic murein transglycosylase D
MNKISVCRLILSAIGIFCLVAWTNPASYSAFSSNLDEQEEIIRERIPTAVSIVNPIYNPAVRSYLDTYLYRRPQQTASMIGWAAVYFPMFEKALADEGLPTDLKYLAIIESALNPVAISRSGAGGLWQFMKPTARECGLKISSYVDERMDPDKSTKAAVSYLKQLYAMFGNWELVMAAYNAGPGRVRSAVKRAGSSDYWKIARFLPEETRSYVPGFIAASYLMNFHDAHNIIPVYPEHAMGELDTIVIYEGMSITEVSKRSGLPIDIVKQLNPSFIRNYIPVSSLGYSIILPFAAAELFNSGRTMEVPDVELADASSSAIVSMNGKTYKVVTKSKEHIVRSGDNLYTIANKNGCTVRDLMDWNGLRNSHLAVGQRLEIRFTVKELITEITEAIVAPLLPARVSQQVNSLASLTPDYFPVDHRAPSVDFDINPVVKEKTTNTLVLQRRQSVRQALYQQANGTVDLQTCSLPSNLCTGEVVRMK